MTTSSKPCKACELLVLPDDLLQHVDVHLLHPTHEVLEGRGRQQSQQGDRDNPSHALPDPRSLNTWHKW